MDRPTIAVVGAGIAGLTAALSLARAGFRVEVFEAAVELTAAGAGIQLSPNALRVLGRLGLLEALADRSVAAGAVTLRSGRTGRVLARVPVAGTDGVGYLAVHRADLQALLLAAVHSDPGIALHLGMALEEAAEERERVVLTLRSRATDRMERREAWLLVGADGVHSQVARSLGRPEARQSGLVAARFTLAGAHGMTGIEAWLGKRRHAVAYPIRGGAHVNIVLIGRETGTGADVAAGFRTWDSRLNALIGQSAFQGVWPLAASEPGRRLVHGRLCLIGDAGHAMLPFAAQGAAMAIEDGYLLARALAGTLSCQDPGAALRRFEAERLPRLDNVRRRVRFHQLAYHLPYPLSLGRDLTLALRPQERLRDDLAWLYDWMP